MKKILLTQGKVALVDDSDFEWLSQWKWQYDPSTGYAARQPMKNLKRTKVYMHRAILNPPIGLLSDHINQDSLDNRRSNLRIVTRQQNSFNERLSKNNTTGYKGVWRTKEGRFVASLKHNYKKILLGTYATAKEAATAYNRKAAELFGEYAGLNKL